MIRSWGGSGSDFIYGNEDNDVLYADDELRSGVDGDFLDGGEGSDYLYGASGADILDGGTGVDTLIGGAGNDTYYIDNTGDIITEGAEEGFDTVSSSRTYTLGANVENLFLIGAEAANGSGNELNNAIAGNDSNNTLTGGVGADTLDGGAGVDIASYASSSTSVIVFLQDDIDGGGVFGDAHNDVLRNIENLDGSSFADVLFGNAGVNVLRGGAGDDRLFGNGDADTLIGGAGSDTASYYTATTGVVVALGLSGIDGAGYSGDAMGDALVSIENITGSGYDDILVGNETGNMLDGYDGVDVLVGGLGNDMLMGQRGDDRYFVLRGHGQDSIVDWDVTAGNTDILFYGTGVTSDQLWFRRVGNNLEVSIIGTSDAVTINNWYSGSAGHVEQIKTADSKMLLDSKVENLVSAMAAFSPPAMGQTTLPSNYQTSLNAVIAANWQ